MSLRNQISTNNLPAWPLIPAIIVACLLNYYSVTFFTDSELIFGNVIAIIALFVYGVLPAVAISVAAGLATYFNFGNVFSIPPFLFEILALHWAITTKRNPVYIGMLYWVTIGWLLVGIEFIFLSDLELHTKYAIIIKYVFNGLLNILVGCGIAQFIMARNWRGGVVTQQRISVLLTNQLFFIVTVAVIIMSFFWLKAFENEKLSDFQQRLQLKANHISSELEHQISGHQKSLILSVQNNNNITDPTKLQQALKHLKDIYPGISTLITTDKNGNVTASSPETLLTQISKSGEINVSDRSYFYEVKNSGKPFVSDIFKGRGYGSAPIIAISVPLKNDLGFVGIMEASLDLELLKEVDKKEVAPEEGLIILDQKNRVIYASKNLNYKFLDDLSSLKLIQHLSSPNAFHVQDEVGNDLIIQSAESSFLGWKTISTLPLSVYDASINNYMTITLTLLGLFIIFSFHLVKWVLRKITKPINALSKALSAAENAEDLLALKLSKGNQELVEITNVEEKLNEFASRSKQLMSDLERAKINQDLANEQLLDLNGNLEKIVESKTEELHHALILANEASDAKDAAKEVAEQAARGKSDFLATMSHEIRTPMNGVLGMAQLLNATPLSVTQKDYVESILNSGSLLQTIIDDVLIYSKLEAGKVELEIVSVNLENLLHEVLEVMSWSLSKNIELILDYPPTIPNVFKGDPARLNQVLFNLVDNAIKFTEEGSVSIIAGFNKDLLTLKVRDTGIGITEQQQEILFKSFNQADTSTTRKYGGTGLGLAICKNMIDLMNGDITIESEYGQGTCFTITLCLEAEVRPVPEKTFNGVTFLLVESDQDHFLMYSNLLNHYGARVIQCSELDSVIDTLVLSKHENNREHLVLISENLLADQEHKFGMLFRDQPELNEVPLVILSPSSNKTSLEPYLESGFSAYLTKPIRSDLFISLLTAALKNSSPTSLITKHSLPDYSRPETIDIELSGHILLVEDVLTNQIVATTMLTDMGLTVDLAEDGLQAIQKWQNNHYDLIFMDCRMPNMDGYEATQQIRSEEVGQKIPIIALTANVTEDDRVKCHDAGMNAVVMKPFKPSDLHMILSEWLNNDLNTLAKKPRVHSGNRSVITLDIETFESTQELLGDAFAELVESIIDEIDDILEKLSNWTDLLDIEGLALLPHSMKSSSAYIGASELNQLAVDCEKNARLGNAEKALSYVNEMKLNFKDVVKDLNTLGYHRSY